MTRAAHGALGLLALLVASLAAAQGNANPNTYSGVQVAVGACLAPPPPAGRDVGTAILTAVISKGVNLLGAALTKAGQDETLRAIGSRNLQGGSGPFPACVQVVRGRFLSQRPEAEPSWFARLSLPANASRKLFDSGIWPAELPDFFFEGAFVTSVDKSALTIRPLQAVMFSVQSAGESFSLRQTSERSVSMFFALSPPGTSPNLTTNPAATVILGPMTLGQVLKYPPGTNETSTPYESAWFTLAEAEARKPLTMTAMIAETRSGNQFLAFLGSIFNDETVKKEITDKANLIIIPGAADAAREKEAVTQRTAATTADQKLVDALNKLRTCKAASSADALSKASEAKIALRDYITADRAQARPAAKVPAELVDQIQLFSPSAVGTQCGAVYNRITGETLP